jgi:hypothetical protein
MAAVVEGTPSLSPNVHAIVVRRDSMTEDWLPLRGRWLRYGAAGLLVALVVGSFLSRSEEAWLLLAAARFASPFLLLAAVNIASSGRSPQHAATADEVHRTAIRRLAIVLVGTLALMFVPPPVTMFRNPPPNALVANWWFRYSAACALVFFSASCLAHRPRPADVPVYLLSLMLAAYIGASLFLWVLRSPHPFGLPSAVYDWWAR